MANYFNWTGSGGTDTSTLENAIPLLLEAMSRPMYGEIDPLHDMFVTSEGVVRNSQSLSRNWTITKVLEGSLRGVVGMNTDSIVYGPQLQALGSTMYRHAAANIPSLMDPWEAPYDIPYQMTITLKAQETTIPRTLADEDIDALPALVAGRTFTGLIEGWARQNALYRISHFYSASSAGILNSISVTKTGTNLTAAGGLTVATWGGSSLETFTDGTDQGEFTFGIPDGNINNYHRGMILDIYSGSTRLNDNSSTRVPLYVKSVDHFNDRVTVVYYNASTSAGMIYTNLEAVNAADGNYTLDIYLRASKGDAHPGLNTWNKALHIVDSAHPNYYDPSSTFYGAALRSYPEHSSVVYDNKNGPLNETNIAGWLMEFATKRQSVFRQSLDTAVMRYGQIVEYNRSRASREVLNRDAVGGSMRELGTQGLNTRFSMTFDGIQINVVLSNFLRSGEAHILKLRENNFKRYVPPIAGNRTIGIPTIDGGTMSLTGMEFEGLGRAIGFPTERIPIVDTSSGRFKHAVQYYARSRQAIVPDQFASIKIENIKEYSATKVS